jgi:hypothetical protein
VLVLVLLLLLLLRRRRRRRLLLRVLDHACEGEGRWRGAKDWSRYGAPRPSTAQRQLQTSLTPPRLPHAPGGTPSYLG